MFKSYLRIALRKFRRQKFFTMINLLGLGIGISASLVIYLIVQHEFDYDRFEKDNDRIYRIVSDLQFPGGSGMKIGGVPYPLADAVRSELTGLETVTHIVQKNGGKIAVPVPGKEAPVEFADEGHQVFADEYYLPLIGYHWVAGDPTHALRRPFELVLAESRAKTYFGNIPPAQMIGRTVIYDDTLQITVTGVVSDLGKPSAFGFLEMISLQTMKEKGMLAGNGADNWHGINSDCKVFVKLGPGTPAAAIDAGIARLRKKYVTLEAGDTDRTVSHLQPMADIHFNPDYDSVDSHQVNKKTLYGLLAVAIFLLAIGCINFINLTTAQSSLRAKEIGIRKTAGSTKGQIIFQFLSETFMLTILATILSIILTPLLLNVFKDFIPPAVGFHSLNQPNVYFFIVLLIIAVTFLAGFYPALVLTRFQPVAVLKGQINSGKQSSRAVLRKTLTVAQFVIAQLLIIATLVVSKQVRFSMNKDLGFKKDAIVVFSAPWGLNDAGGLKKKLLLQKLAAIPGIERAGIGGSSPSSNGWSSNTMEIDAGGPNAQLDVQQLNGDPNYYKIYQLKLVAGRWLQPSDSSREYLINETYARDAGFRKPADAIGHTIKEKSGIPIVGVVADFHTKSTHMPIPRLALTSQSEYSSTLHVALVNGPDNAANWKATIAKMDEAYREVYPGETFNYSFFDETIAKFYDSEQKITRLLSWASGLTIFISCLGMLGLVIYITNTRNKEIGMRKVLGASVTQIVTLLSRDFLLLVILAFVIVVPIAWWLMHDWLQDFQYRTSLSWWVFGLTGTGMLLLAMLILGLRTRRAATQNPVNLLRSE